MRLQAETRAPARAARRASSTRCSRRDRPVIFAYHGYPWLIHRLTYRRTNHANLHVRGYKEEGTTTTPVRHGDAQRPRPVPPRDGRDRPGAGARVARRAELRQQMVDRRVERPRVHARARRGPARDPRLDVAGVDARPTDGPGVVTDRDLRDPRRQRRVQQPEAACPRAPTTAWRRRPTCRRRTRPTSCDAVRAGGRAASGGSTPWATAWSTAARVHRAAVSGRRHGAAATAAP